MTKDRIKELKASQQGEDEFEMLEVQLFLEVENGFMKDFAKEVGELLELVDQLGADTKRVQETHFSILSTPGIDKKLEDELKDLSVGIKETSQQVRFRLKAIEVGIERAEEVSESAAELRIKKIQHSTIRRKFLESVTDYYKSQNDFRQSLIEKFRRQSEIAGKQFTQDELEEMIEKGKDVSFFTEGIVVQDLAEDRLLLSDIEARHADIVKLETSIKELHDLFVDMAVLVDAQGEMIDRIEMQVNDAVEWVDRATADTKKAKEFQAAGRKKKLMMIFAGTIVIVGIFVAFLISHFS